MLLLAWLQKLNIRDSYTLVTISGLNFARISFQSFSVVRVQIRLLTSDCYLFRIDNEIQDILMKHSLSSDEESVLRASQRPREFSPEKS